MVWNRNASVNKNGPPLRGSRRVVTLEPGRCATGPGSPEQFSRYWHEQSEEMGLDAVAAQTIFDAVVGSETAQTTFETLISFLTFRCLFDGV